MMLTVVANAQLKNKKKHDRTLLVVKSSLFAPMQEEIMDRMDQRLVGESPKVSKNNCIAIRKGDIAIDGRDTLTGQDMSRI